MPETTVLVVDDDKSILTALRMTLEGEYVVCTAEKGAEALRLLRDKEPEVILLDIGLPDTSGIELIGQIKSIDPEAPLPGRSPNCWMRSMPLVSGRPISSRTT